MAYKIKKQKLKKILPYELLYELRGSKMKNYPMTSLSKIKTKEEARTMAIDYQNWASEQSMSYGELVEYQNYFEKLGKKFGLKEEFKENGII